MGKYWSHLAGEQYGQTHTVYTLPEDGEGAMATWNHPLDIHLTTTSIQGWPRILVQVRKRETRLARDATLGPPSNN